MIHKRVCDSYSYFYDTQRVLCVTDAMQKGFSRSNLLYMIHSAEFHPDEHIVSALKRQLSLTHFLLEFGTDFSFAVREAQ